MLVKLLLGNLLKHLEVQVQKEKQNCFALLQLAGGDCKSECPSPEKLCQKLESAED